MYDIGVAGAAQPVASPAEGQRVDHAVFVAPPHLLQQVAVGSVEDADVDALLARGGQLVAVQGHANRVQN